MHRNITITSVLALVLVLASAPAVLARAPDVERPFKAYAVGHATFVFGATDPITGGTCPHFGGLATTSSMRGTASHLGRVVITGSHCTPLADEAVTGRMTLVAANGDELVIDYHGPIAPPAMSDHGVTALYSTTVIGPEGTGRFEGSGGSGTLIVDFTFDDFFDEVWLGDFTLSGRISY